MSNVTGGPATTFQYTWESSSDSLSWTVYTGAGINSETIQPVLNSKTFFRAAVTSGVCKDSFALGVLVKPRPVVVPSSPQTLCVGASTVLSASGADTYSWDQGIGAGNTISVTPTGTTTYKVTGTTNGCADDSSVTITVNSKTVPTITIIDPGKICSAEEVTISANAGNAGTAPKYVWSLASASKSDTTTAPSIKKNWPLGSQQLTVTVLAGPGCFATAEDNQAFDVVGLSAGKTDTLKSICFSDAILPVNSTEDAAGGTGPGPIYYQWQDSTSGIQWKDISGANIKSFTPASISGIEYFRRRAVNGTTHCDTAYAKIVTYVKAAQILGGKIGPNPRAAICANVVPSTFTNIADPSNGSPNDLSRFTYSWKVSTDNLTFTTVTTTASDGLTYTPTAALKAVDTTTYYFVRTATDKSCGAANSDTVSIKVLPVLQPGISIIDPLQICRLDKVTLNTKIRNGGAVPTYSWTYNGMITAQTAGTYTNTNDWAIPSVVTVKLKPSADICSTGPVDTTLTLKIQDAVVPSVQVSALPAVNVCATATPQTFKFIARPVTGMGSAPQYQFTTVRNSVATIVRAFATDSSFNTSNLADGDSVIVVMKSNSSCAVRPLSAPTGIQVHLVPTPIAVLPQPAPVCYPNKILLTAQGGIATSQYQWYKGTVKIAGATAATFSTDETGVNFYSVAIINKGYGLTCENTSKVVATNIEKLVVDAGTNLEIKLGDGARLSGHRSPTYPVIWKTADTTFHYDSDSLRPSVNPVRTSKYYLTLTSPLTGCKATDSTEVLVLLPIHIPNAISPNSDGLNDTWVIDGIDTYPGNEIRVFNRWGNVIYEKYGYTNAEGWNGTTTGGSQLPVAVYYYIVDPKNSNGGGPYTGWITVVR